jgi:hypothetical protein
LLARRLGSSAAAKHEHVPRAREAQLEAADIDRTSERHCDVDADVLRRELNGDPVRTRSVARCAPSAAVRMAALVNETCFHEPVAWDLRERPHGDVDVQRASRLFRQHLHGHPSDDGVRSPSCLQNCNDRPKRLLLRVARRKAHRLSPQAI